MSKRTIGIFFIVNLIMVVIGVGLIIAGVVGSTYTTSTNGSSQITSFGNLPLFVTGVVIASLSGIPYLIAWIGALVNLARLQQWVWFVLVLIFHWIALLVYLIAGPTTPIWRSAISTIYAASAAAELPSATTELPSVIARFACSSFFIRRDLDGHSVSLIMDIPISSKNLQPLDNGPACGVGRVGKLVDITLPICMIELGQPTVAVIEE